MGNLQPKILVITVSTWNNRTGANTYASLLENYDNSLVANLCIREDLPTSKVASRYFRISEGKILKSILKRRTKTGAEIQTLEVDNEDTLLEEHKARYSKFQKKRRYSMLLARELVWKLGKWKSKELDQFLDDFKPDIILHSMEGYIHLNRIIEYAINRTGAKAIGYIWDDNFTYKQHSNLGYKFYRYFQRKSLKRLAKKTTAFFAITEKTKKEADEFFKIDSIVLTKPLSSEPVVSYGELSIPIKMLYTGNLYIGRDKTLLRIVKAIKRLNLQNNFEIDVYTNTVLSNEIKEEINCDFCRLHDPIPQNEALQKQKNTDVLLFLEDIDGKNSKVARLSFSTKTTDYLSSGKCIFAVGNRDVAPIEYLRENDAAIVACNDLEIERALNAIFSNCEILGEYAQNSASLGIKKHSREKIERIFYETLSRVFIE